MILTSDLELSLFRQSSYVRDLVGPAFFILVVHHFFVIE